MNMKRESGTFLETAELPDGTTLVHDYDVGNWWRESADGLRSTEAWCSKREALQDDFFVLEL